MIVVTGATGFIGSHLCRALLAEGYPVRAFHRRDSPLGALEGLPVEHVVGDILQPETLAPAMQGAQAVFHTAARLNSTRQAGTSYAATTQGTHNVLHAAHQAGVGRVVHTSSVAALGVPLTAPFGAAPALLAETHTWNFPPTWWEYGYAKYQAELEVQAAVAMGQDSVIVNPSVVLGPRDLNRICGEVILQAGRGRLFVSPPGGLNVVHVDDVVAGHLAAWRRGYTGQRYILGGENLTYRQFLTQVAEIVGRRAPLAVIPAWLLRLASRPTAWLGNWFRLPIAGHALRRAGLHFYYDTSLARQELALPAPLPAREAIQDAYTWYHQMGWV